MNSSHSTHNWSMRTRPQRSRVLIRLDDNKDNYEEIESDWCQLGCVQMGIGREAREAQVGKGRVRDGLPRC